jgi:hypothetical protein
VEIHHIMNKKPTEQPKQSRWGITGWTLKCILLTAIIANKPPSTQNSDGGDTTQERPLDLTHDNHAINLPGSAYPIKSATMTLNRKKIRDSKKSRKTLCVKIRMLEILTKYTLLGILSTILSGIAYLGGRLHKITILFINSWIAALETALTEFNITMTSFLHTETTGIACPLFKLLIGLLRLTYLKH